MYRWTIGLSFTIQSSVRSAWSKREASRTSGLATGKNTGVRSVIVMRKQVSPARALVQLGFQVSIWPNNTCRRPYHRTSMPSQSSAVRSSTVVFADRLSGKVRSTLTALPRSSIAIPRVLMWRWILPLGKTRTFRHKNRGRQRSTDSRLQVPNIAYLLVLRQSRIL